MVRDSERRNPELANDLVMIGEIVKPHGIHGKIKVYPYSERPENFKLYKEVFLQEPGAGQTGYPATGRRGFQGGRGKSPGEHGLAKKR